MERALRILHDALRSDDSAPRRVGDVTLHPHQREAVNLLRTTLRRFGGALLADPVGTGKTFTALGVAGAYRRVLIAAPAVLRDMWTASLARAGLQAAFVSLESLSRGAPTAAPFDLVVVDEAHHVRNPGTRRFARLARITTGAHVLLLSATPLHNRPADLHALTSLFLGTPAQELEADVLAEVIVRRSEPASAVPLPDVQPAHWLPVIDDDQVLRAILTLPPPVPPADGGTANALGTIVLARQWCSSDAALLAALDRRLRHGAVMAHRLSHGHLPSRAELLHWVADTLSIQLALPLDAKPPRMDDLEGQLRRHLDAARSLRDRVRASPGRDDQRIVALRQVLGEHRDRRAVLFSHSIDTARMWFRRLAPLARVACLDGTGGRVASGRLSRREILQAFAPRTPGEARSAPPAMVIDTLVATDVLSEGVGLHDAALVVHLDLPWTVARIEQRIGRLRRMGSPHSHVLQYAFEPPTTANNALQLLQRLAGKAGLVESLVGMDASRPGWIGGSPSRRPLSPADARDALRAATHRWGSPESSARTPQPRSPAVATPRLGAVVGSLPSPAFLAVVEWADGPQVVGGTGDAVTTEPITLVHLAHSVARHAIPAPTAFADKAMRMLTVWTDHALARRQLLVSAGAGTPAHRRALRTLHATMRTARRPVRQALVPLVTDLRDLILSSVGAGFELLLAEWNAAHPEPDGEALQRLAAELRARARPLPVHTKPRVLALLLLVPR